MEPNNSKTPGSWLIVSCGWWFLGQIHWGSLSPGCQGLGLGWVSSCWIALIGTEMWWLIHCQTLTHAPQILHRVIRMIYLTSLRIIWQSFDSIEAAHVHAGWEWLQADVATLASGQWWMWPTFRIFFGRWCCTYVLPTQGQPSVENLSCISLSFCQPPHQHLLAMMPKTGGRPGLDMKTSGIINLPPHSEINPGRNRSNGPKISLSMASNSTKDPEKHPAFPGTQNESIPTCTCPQSVIAQKR